MSGSIQRYFSTCQILPSLELATCIPEYKCVFPTGVWGGEQCCETLTEANWHAGLNALRRIQAEYHDEAYLKQELGCAAEKLLCVRLHQDQKYDIVKKWLATQTRIIRVQHSYSTRK